jgi:hypothetical protein
MSMQYVRLAVAALEIKLQAEEIQRRGGRSSTNPYSSVPGDPTYRIVVPNFA